MDNDFGPTEIDLLRHQKQWVETEIQKVFPWESCARCAEPDNPEDGSGHVDHFFDWVRTR